MTKFRISNIFEKLENFKTIDLPEKQLPFWKIAGPGAILVGLSIGAGEIVIWPRIAAQYGGSMVWAAVLGVFLQLWINFEVGRWTITTGETVYTGYSRIWRGFAPLFTGVGTRLRTCAEGTSDNTSWMGFRYILDCRYFRGCRTDPLRS